MGDGTVQDCRTGLIWLQEANCTDSLGGIDKSLGYLNWYDAMTWVKALGTGACGLTDGSGAGDWRLPTKAEWMAMIASAKKQGFTNPTLTNAAGTAKWTTDGDAFNNAGYIYWSSTPYYGSDYIWYVEMYDGTMYGWCKGECGVFVWPVRGGQSGEFGSITIQ